jgi:hypothetical protein
VLGIEVIEVHTELLALELMPQRLCDEARHAALSHALPNGLCEVERHTDRELDRRLRHWQLYYHGSIRLASRRNRSCLARLSGRSALTENRSAA